MIYWQDTGHDCYDNKHVDIKFSAHDAFLW
jgi:hypothetical protein